MAPTWAVPGLFFLQTTILTLIGPLFRNNPETTKPPKAKSRLSPKSFKKVFQSPRSPFHFLFLQRKPTKPDVPKGSPLWIFCIVRLFLNIFNVPKGSPSSFLIFSSGMYGNKSRRVPLLHFSALCDFFERNNFSKNFKVFFQKNVLRFLSLRYGADFRRSRLIYFGIILP